MMTRNRHSRPITINPRPLTAREFASYGDVIEVSDDVRHFTINQGYTERFHDLARVDVSAQNGQPLINIFRSKPLPLPITLKMMEAHPLSSQAFIPLGNQPYLVAVAANGPFDVAAVEVFLASSKQGVNYHRGTWHHFCLALNEESDFLVIDRGGEGENCNEIHFSPEQYIVVNF